METPQEAADRILSVYWDGTLPVNPIQIANDMGLDVYASGDIPDGGGVIKKVNGHPSIYICKNDSTVRQRFTIFHEIGHYVLGHYDEYGEMQRTYGFRYNQNEVDADEFAAEMLMPRSYVISCVNKGYTFKKMQDIFQASSPAMSRRLRGLGLV